MWWEETIIDILSKCSSLAQKWLKARHDWVKEGKLKFDQTPKWYMHKLESILKNETHKIHLDFKIQTDHLIPARRSDLVIINKKKKKEKKKEKKKKENLPYS